MFRTLFQGSMSNMGNKREVNSRFSRIFSTGQFPCNECVTGETVSLEHGLTMF
jgi:hypothetical protein